METKLCKLLHDKAQQLADMYSDPTKARKNVNGIRYDVDRVLVCSDLTGAVVLRKSNGQRALIWCYWVTYQTRDGNDGEFRWLTIRYDHLYGMTRLLAIMANVEQRNYRSNVGAAPVPAMQSNDEWLREYGDE